jgi:hypothetical protein
MPLCCARSSAFGRYGRYVVYVVCLRSGDSIGSSAEVLAPEKEEGGRRGRD